MEEKRWKQAFEDITLTSGEKEALWEQMRQKRRKRSLGRSLLRTAAMLAVIACAGIGTTLIVDGFTGGRLASALSGIWKAEEESGQIVETVTDLFHIRLDNVYAPELIECSDERAVFANPFGLVVYDRKRQCVTGTADLEKIQCNYFNADTLQTKFLVTGDRLTVYNLSGKKVSGSCYVFDLGKCRNQPDGGIVALEPTETRKASPGLEKKWKNQSKNRILTWEYAARQEEKELAAVLYSEYSLQWESQDHTAYSSFLVIGEKEHTEGSHGIFLYHWRADEERFIRELLNIHVDGIDNVDGINIMKKELPAYQYTGDDPMEKALVDLFENDRKRYEGQLATGRKISGELSGEAESEHTDLTVPLIDIVGVKKGKKYTIAYGTFGYEWFSLSGTTLYASGSSGGVGAAYLKETADGYEVKKILRPRDGGLFAKDLRTFCKGDETMVSKILDYDTSRVAVCVLKKYVKQNGLEIRYYKEFGWDPQKIG